MKSFYKIPPLPKPSCRHGFTRQQIQEMFGTIFTPKFDKWMQGQTYCSCTGKEYSHDLKKYVAGCSEPHGSIYYVDDVLRFIAGMPVTD